MSEVRSGCVVRETIQSETDRFYLVVSGVWLVNRRAGVTVRGATSEEVEMSREIERQYTLLKDWEEVDADHKRLVRELDVLLNGTGGAAKQASLCDIVGQLAYERAASAKAGK